MASIFSGLRDDGAHAEAEQLLQVVDRLEVVGVLDGDGDSVRARVEGDWHDAVCGCRLWLEFAEHGVIEFDRGEVDVHKSALGGETALELGVIKEPHGDEDLADALALALALLQLQRLVDLLAGHVAELPQHAADAAALDVLQEFFVDNDRHRDGSPAVVD